MILHFAMAVEARAAIESDFRKDMNILDSCQIFNKLRQ